MSLFRSNFVAVLLCAGLSVQGLAADKATNKKVSQKVDKITFTNKLVDGKKVWLPADAKVKAGRKVEVTLINTLAEPHGFTVPGVSEDAVVNANETKTISFEAKTAGTYPFKCQLHPAHIGGNIVIAN